MFRRRLLKLLDFTLKFYTWLQLDFEVFVFYEESQNTDFQNLIIAVIYCRNDLHELLLSTFTCLLRK